MITDKDMRNAAAGARRSHRASRNYVELDDLIGEAYLWLAKNERKLDEWREQGRKGENMVQLSAYRAAQKFVAKERMRKTGSRYGEQFYYTHAILENLLPDVWTYSTWPVGTVVDDSNAQRSSKPAEGNNRAAMMSDVTTALKRLPVEDVLLLKERYMGYGTPLQVMADERNVHHSTISRRIDHILTKMVDSLGGENPWA